MPSKYRRLYAAVAATPWAILPEKMRAIEELLELRRGGRRLSPEEIEARIGPPRGAVSVPADATGVMVIAIHGTIVPRAGAIAQSSGLVSLDAVNGLLAQAEHDPTVRAVVLSFDTPGGNVAGVAETAAAIRRLKSVKPVYGIANYGAYSAGYYLASQASELSVSPSGGVGSVGVIYQHFDETAAMEKAGVRRTLIYAGQYKAEGWGALSDEARAAIQARVDTYYQAFIADVALGRNIAAADVLSRFGQGRVVMAEEAVSRGMADRIETLSELFDRLGVAQPGSSGARASATSSPASLAGSAQLWSATMNLHEALIRLGVCGLAATQAAQLAAARVFLVARGHDVPAADTDLEAAIVALAKVATPPAPVAAAPAPLVLPPAAAVLPQPSPAPAPTPAPATADAGGYANRLAAIVPMVRLAGIDNPLETATQLAHSQLSLEQVQQDLIARRSAQTQPAGPGPQVVSSEIDTLRAVARDAILVRQGESSLPPGYQLAAGAREAHGLQSLHGLARQCLIASGAPVNRVLNLDVPTLARVIMGQMTLPGMSASSPAWNTTGLYSNILLDAANVTARAGYQQTATTFQRWMQRGPDIADFKAVNRVILGELPFPKVIPENGTFEESTATDGKESYKLTVWGQMFSLTWQAIVNDQLGEFMKVPQKQGTAMRLRQEQLAYQVLKDNAALSDGTALFASGHSNLAGSGGAFSVSTLNTAFAAMLTQTALGGAAGTALNLMPRYVIFPVQIRAAVLQLLQSIADPAAGGSAAGNSNTANIYRGALEPIEAPVLGNTADGGSTTAWYLAASGSQIDTIEYAYLQGMADSPQIDEFAAEDRLVRRYRIYQCFGVKALDHRGLYKNPGA